MTNLLEVSLCSITILTIVKDVSLYQMNLSAFTGETLR